MFERFGNKDKKPKLAMAAGAALLAGVSSAQASELKNTVESFEQKKLERLVESGQMALTDQILFVETSLKSGGEYLKNLNDPTLSEERLSEIFKVVNAVSARVTMMYEKNPLDSQMKDRFADVSKLRASTRHFQAYKSGSGTIDCNSFVVQNHGEAFEVSANHCIEGTGYQKDFYHVNGSDIAVKFVPKEKWGETSISNIKDLPVVHSATTSENSYGNLVTSFSVAPDGSEKIHFSFAMPLPAKKLLVFNPKQLEELKAIGSEDFSMFFKPYEEGMFKPGTKNIRASGSSGSPIMAQKAGILGPYLGTKEVAIQCSNRCYALSFFESVNITQKALDEERNSRKAGHQVANGR
jgi:hypothetical protein